MSMSSMMRTKLPLRVRGNVLVWAGLLAGLAAPGVLASQLAGTVHIRRGAVSAFSGRGEDEQVRRGVTSLRVDLDEHLRTSPDVDAIFIAHDETQTSLEPSARYQVERDGVWKVGDDQRVRVLEFLRPPGRRWRKGLPTTSTSLATVRGDGAPRAKGTRDFEPQLLEADKVLGPNATVHTGLADEILLALVQNGRVLLHGDGAVRIQRQALVLESGWMHLRAGGPARVVMTATQSVAATEGALYELEVGRDGGTRVRVLDGFVVVGPAPGLRGPRLKVQAGQELTRDPGSPPQVATVLRAGRLAAGARGLQAALAMDAPRAAAEAAQRASHPPEGSAEDVHVPVPPQIAQVPAPRAASGWERPRAHPAPAPMASAHPQAPPAVGFAQGPARSPSGGLSEEDEAAMAVAETLGPAPTPAPSGSFGSPWESRERRQPRLGRSAPAELPPGLISRTDSKSLQSASHPLWSSAHAVRTPGL